MADSETRKGKKGAAKSSKAEPAVEGLSKEETKAAIAAYEAFADTPPLNTEAAASPESREFPPTAESGASSDFVSSDATPSKGGHNLSALFAAIENGNAGEVRSLASNLGTGLLENGFNVLMYAAANRKGAACVQSLLGNSQFDINARSTGKVYNFPWNEEYVLEGQVEERFEDDVSSFDEGLTAIQLAALSGSLLSFSELLKAGASLGPDTKQGRNIKQLIGLRYEPGGADSKRALVKALLENANNENEDDEEVKAPAGEAKSERKDTSAASTTASEGAPNVVFHMPTDSKDSEKKAEPPVFLFSVKGQQGAIPQVGFGTANMTLEGIKSALKLGVRHLDGALLYGTQELIGKALAESGLQRDEVFITSKVSFFPGPGVWMFNENNLKGQEAASIDLCLKQLNVKHVDLMLIHNGIASIPEYNASMVPHHFELKRLQGDEKAVRPESLPGGESIREAVLLGLREKARQSRAKDPAKAAKEARALREKAWKALEQAQKEGKCTHIGVANYPPELIQEMQEYATVMPCVNQVELHPSNSHPRLRKLCQELGIVLTAYGSGFSVRIENSPVVADIAARLKKSPLQVVLKWTLQHGVVVIPAAKQEAHIKENMDLFNFELSEDDMAKLNAMNQDHPYYWDPKPTQDTVR